jgi:hypothetical protein
VTAWRVLEVTWLDLDMTALAPSYSLGVLDRVRAGRGVDQQAWLAAIFFDDGEPEAEAVLLDAHHESHEGSLS